jgi:hypothetical protein
MMACLCLMLALFAAGPEHPAAAGPLTGLPPQTPSTAPLAAAWEVPVEGTSVPYVAGMDDRVVVADREGRLAAYGTDGTPQWTRALGTPLAAAPLAVGTRLAALGKEGTIFLVDAATGEVSGRAGPFGSGSFLSRVSGGLAVADPAGTITLLDTASGSPLWSRSIVDAPSAPAGECDGVVLAGTTQGSIAALKPDTGALLWRRRLAQATITTTPGCNERMAYAGSADNRLHAFKIGRRRANPTWSYNTGGDIVGTPFLYGGRVLFFSYDTYLYALEADNGHLAWKVRLGRRPQPQSVVMGNVLVVAPLNTEKLETFQLPAGTQGPSLSLPAGQGRFVSPPAAAGSRVVIAAAAYGQESARVIAVDPVPAKPQPVPVP